MASAASLLALIDEAIEALLTGGAQQYSIGSRTVTKLDLKSLFEERPDFKALSGEWMSE